MMDSCGRAVTRQGSLIPIDRLPAGKLGGGGKWGRDIKRGGKWEKLVTPKQKHLLSYSLVLEQLVEEKKFVNVSRAAGWYHNFSSSPSPAANFSPTGVVFTRTKVPPKNECYKITRLYNLKGRFGAVCPLVMQGLKKCWWIPSFFPHIKVKMWTGKHSHLIYDLHNFLSPRGLVCNINFSLFMATFPE